jgi:hypothetical protein
MFTESISARIAMLYSPNQFFVSTLPQPPSSEEEAAKRYQNYRAEFESRFTRKFVETHSKSQW